MKCSTASSSPDTKNQMTLRRQDTPPPSFSTFLPNGRKESEAILKHCTPTGAPTIVMHHRHPAISQESAQIQPPKMIHKIFPRVFITISFFPIC